MAAVDGQVMPGCLNGAASMGGGLARLGEGGVGGGGRRAQGVCCGVLLDAGVLVHMRRGRLPTCECKPVGARACDVSMRV